jgi:hypothetical protein
MFVCSSPKFSSALEQGQNRQGNWLNWEWFFYQLSLLVGKQGVRNKCVGNWAMMVMDFGESAHKEKRKQGK